jgi:hypothetical protein
MTDRTKFYIRAGYVTFVVLAVIVAAIAASH